MAQTHESQLEQLQAELADLRRKSEKRSFKQVMKDGYNKVYRVMHTANSGLSDTEEWIIGGFVILSIVLFVIFSVAAFAFMLVYTEGLILLFIPIYPLYLIFRKEQ